ncbi:uncharacterized protein BXZ73DRAFT_44397 [Epithele typhae]|uniref:uncharacterized protein n=1 Tax=Epithele typhae TaxID=378194 RepID=UPI0020073317|nr:uncharacterized protein BXZ73DRAFT_44397 [Epithele typhae]KAH9938886.1 hypothetical protein BXZ73DRAFT_44397 [Epithele typhae]
MSALLRAAAAPSVRAAARQTSRRQGARLAHTEAHEAPHLPFKYQNRRAFAVKYVASVSTFFAIPLIAVGYQL